MESMQVSSGPLSREVGRTERSDARHLHVPAGLTAFGPPCVTELRDEGMSMPKLREGMRPNHPPLCYSPFEQRFGLSLSLIPQDRDAVVRTAVFEHDEKPTLSPTFQVPGP